MNQQSPIVQSSSLSDNGRFRSALKMLEDTLKLTNNPAVSLICTYKMGAIHWSSLGNGSRARELYKKAVQIARSGQLPSEDVTVKTIRANSCENLMLLSLSYEEYEDWSLQLRELQPKNDILRNHVPAVLNAGERGFPWSDILQDIANSYYNRGDSAMDPGRYGCGASTWELLLTNRKKLRLSREPWQRAVYEFGTLTMRIASDAITMMGKTPQGPDLDECLFMVDPAIQFSKEFLATNPDDEMILKLMENLEEFCRSTRAEFERITSTLRCHPHAAGSSLIRSWLRKLLGKTEAKPFAPALQQNKAGGSKLLTESARCCRCGAKMTIFLGVGRIGMFPRAVLFHQSHQGCFRCGACGRYYCWDHSDSREPCICGKTAWQERLYFPAGVMPEQELKDLL